MSILIDGKALAAEMRGQLSERVQKFKGSRGKDIGLAVVLVGEDPASQVYVRNKIRACEEVGIRSFAYRLPETAERKSVAEDRPADERIHRKPLSGGPQFPVGPAPQGDLRGTLRRYTPVEDC